MLLGEESRVQKCIVYATITYERQGNEKISVYAYFYTTTTGKINQIPKEIVTCM